MEFGRALRTIRALRDVTQTELGKRAGVTHGFISAIESGKVYPGRELEERLREALQWTSKTDAWLTAAELETGD